LSRSRTFALQIRIRKMCKNKAAINRTWISDIYEQQN
jgi:hypothetical protein